MLTALDRELAHLATPSGICSKTSRAPPCSNTIILRSSAKKPGFHLPCLRMTFNLLVMNCYYPGRLMTGAQVQYGPPTWMATCSKGLQERPETRLITNSIPPPPSVNLSLRSFRLTLGSATYKEVKRSRSLHGLELIDSPSSAPLLPTHQPPCASSL